MSTSAWTWWLAIGALLLLLPATVAFGVLVVLSYPAYPLPDPHWMQQLFDVGMALLLLGFVAAWWLLIGALRGGRSAWRRAAFGWPLLLGAGAAVGLLGAAVAIAHMLDPYDAADWVGYALLAPGLPLALLWLPLWRVRRAAG